MKILHLMDDLLISFVLMSDSLLRLDDQAWPHLETVEQ